MDSLLEVKNLNIKYNGQEKSILENSSFEVKPGELVIILGHNGSGKTSILKAILGLNDKKSKISLDLYFEGKKIDFRDIDEFRSKIGFTPQEDDKDNFFVRKTKSYILEYASNAKNPEGNYEKYEELYKRFECKNYLNGGLETKKLKKCSGGEKKMVAILRAFSRSNSKLYILDEPTNNLDIRRTLLLNDYLLDLKKSKNKPGIIIITHSHIFQNVDKVYKIENFKLVLGDKKERTLDIPPANKDGYYYKKEENKNE